MWARKVLGRGCVAAKAAMKNQRTPSSLHSLNNVLSTSSKFETNNNVIAPLEFNNIVTRTYVKQRKVKVPFVSPWDMLDFYKEKMKNIPRLADVRPGEIIEIENKILEENIRLLEEAKRKGITPGQELLEEFPEVKKYIDKVNMQKPAPGQWTPNSRRVGAIAIKVGMFPQWNEHDYRMALTALFIPKCQVLQVKTEEKEGYTALQIGAADMKLKRATKPLIGHCSKAGVAPKHAITEVRVTPDAILPPGTEITARHFVPGQFVDVTGRTVGKGFAGPMKRWGFSGGPASHGASLSHRSHGSTGQRTRPGRVFKGKKMAGRLGGKQQTEQNLWVYMIDIKNNIVFVKGSVPGKNGSYVLIRDAYFKKFTTPPPFPTFVPPPDEDIENMPYDKCLLKASTPMPYELKEIEAINEELRQEKAKMKKGAGGKKK